MNNLNQFYKMVYCLKQSSSVDDSPLKYLEQVEISPKSSLFFNNYWLSVLVENSIFFVLITKAVMLKLTICGYRLLCVVK